MNVCERDVLIMIKKNGKISQRELGDYTGYSLGVIKKSLKSLYEKGYLDRKSNLTELSKLEFSAYRPQRAIILAAGLGMRMVPIGRDIPKALLKVRGEVLIERTIQQLHEVGIFEVHIVVGFMKDKFEYLMDKYGVNLIVNPVYAVTNNMLSLNLVAAHLNNAYIIPSDIWMNDNPYSSAELYSWYLVSEELCKTPPVRCNRKRELVKRTATQFGNRMVGISYLAGEVSNKIKLQIADLLSKSGGDQLFWEEALYEKNKMIVYAKVCDSKNFTEFDTYEQVRTFDHKAEQLQSPILKIITEVFDTATENITNISLLKKGMTNRSFLFDCKGKRYIMRIPGEGTEKIINRVEEKAVYQAIKSQAISDEVFYMDATTGYKITEYLDKARTCEPTNKEEVLLCMQKLRKFHEKKLRVKHEFDLFRQIEFYESLRNPTPSIFDDYAQTKAKIYQLRKYIETCKSDFTLCHIDAIPDNFLFVEEDIYLIDWEYAGMQDPHVDIAMFAVYALYNKKQIDELIDMYFIEGCNEKIRIKIYCYIAVCGLLWSNWCEYKSTLGVEFGEYSLRQYRYANDFYTIAVHAMEEAKGEENAQD